MQAAGQINPRKLQIEKRYKKGRKKNIFRQTIRMFKNAEQSLKRLGKEKLLRILEEFGVKGQLLDNIRTMYANRRSVRASAGLTKWF